jgi:hypothetical protein
MSGGGGSGGSYSPPDTGVSCANLKFDAPVQSVDPGAVQQLAEGEDLAVRLGTADGASVVEIVTGGGDYVGALIDRIADLLRCIQDGYQYVATVVSIDGGDVRVRVQARR